MPIPQQGPVPQGAINNPQFFAQLLQQMGSSQPNLQGPTQVPMPMPQQKPDMPMPMPQQKPPVPPPGAPQFSGIPQMPPGTGSNNVPLNSIPQVSPQQMQPPMQQGPGAGPAQMSPQQMQLMQQIMQRQAMQQQQPQQGQGQPGQQGQQGQRFTPQELGALGRMGDTTVAHLTPGEMTVPPQVQTPKVLATLKQEYHKKGVDPSQFTVGSPNSHINPRTGVPEYNFWSSVLPMAGGLAGSLLLGPEFAGLMGSSALAGSAVGGGLGSLAGGLISGQDPMQAALTSGFGALGSYGLGSMFTGPGSAAAGAAGEAAQNPAVNSFAQDSFPTASMGAQNSSANAFLNPQAQGAGNIGPTMNNAAASARAGMPMGSPSSGWGNIDSGVAAKEASTPPGLGNLWGSGINAGDLIGGQIGSMIGQGIYDGNKPVQPFQGQPKYKSAGELPSFQQQLGYNTYNGPKPNFSGYNPMTNNPAAFNFFPVPNGS